jgi:hypothetical protein
MPTAIRHERVPKTEAPSSFHTPPERPRESLAESWWIFESLALFVSFLSFFAMFTVLVKFNNRPLHEWHSTVTLNAIVSLSSLVSKSALILPLASGLSQLKWKWYRHGSGRRLMDFEYFDAASRGPWGAFILMLHGTAFPLATLGGFVMVTVLAFEPFIQQAVIFPTRNITTGVAQIPRIAFWNGSFDSSYKVAAYDALLGFNLSKTASAISPICSTGNCSFLDYSSLAFCSQCVDVSSYLSLSSGNPQIANELDSFGCSEYTDYNATSISGICPSKVTAPNGLTLDYIVANTESTSSWDSKENGLSIMNTSSEALISNALDAHTLTYTFLRNFSMIARTVPKPTAYDCVISTCAKRYTADVLNGQFRERVRSTFTNMTQINTSEFPYNGSGVEVVGPGTTTSNLNFNLTTAIPANSSDSGTDELFNIGYVSVGGFGKFLQNSLEGNIVSTTNYSDGSFYPSFPTSDYMQGLWEHGIENIPQTLDGLATAWTNNIRLAGQPAQGTATQDQTFIQVQFLWLILPFALELLALLFFIVTVFQSKSGDIPTWKASSLAPLLHGSKTFNSPMLDPQLETISEMEEFANSSKTRLIQENNQWTMQIIKDESQHAGLGDMPFEPQASPLRRAGRSILKIVRGIVR